MAKKDLTLNPKIEKACFDEFMKYGYQAASVNRIAKNAGVTSGAIYTRYKNKNEMFESLLTNLISLQSKNNNKILLLYQKAMESKTFDDFYIAMCAEKQVNSELLFEYYDEFQLLLCKSTGSLIAKKLNHWIESKVKSTCSFMSQVSGKPMNKDLIEHLLIQQLNDYKYILEKNYTKKEAIAFLDEIHIFYDAGWKVFFKQITEN